MQCSIPGFIPNLLQVRIVSVTRNGRHCQPGEIWDVSWVEADGILGVFIYSA